MSTKDHKHHISSVSVVIVHGLQHSLAIVMQPPVHPPVTQLPARLHRPRLLPDCILIVPQTTKTKVALPCIHRVSFVLLPMSHVPKRLQSSELSVVMLLRRAFPHPDVDGDLAKVGSFFVYSYLNLLLIPILQSHIFRLKKSQTFTVSRLSLLPFR